jgi:hypothetical protein
VQGLLGVRKVGSAAAGTESAGIRSGCVQVARTSASGSPEGVDGRYLDLRGARVAGE